MKIAVIGAGAAGLSAAITAAEAGAEVTVYEHMKEAGRKLLMTGNGKCNLTNMNMFPEAYFTDCEDSHKEKLLHELLNTYTPERIREWFYEHGLLTRSRNGYVYPYCEQASAVRDILLQNCTRLGVDFRYGYDCYQELKEEKNRRAQAFIIEGKIYDRLILACGGKSARVTGSDGSGYELAKLFGHHIARPEPALVQLHTDLPDFKMIAGVRAQGSVSFMGYTETGEIQFTEFGISGIPVFQISRHVVKQGYAVKPSVLIDLLPEYSCREISLFIRGQWKAATQNKRCPESDTPGLSRMLKGIIHEKLIAYILHIMGYENPNGHETDALKQVFSDENMMKKAADLIAKQIKEFRIPVTGSHKLDAAQVTQGGVLLSEINEHFESVYVKGLFLAGEMLDIDGICGGYNLHFAWASGQMAGSIRDVT